MKVKMSKTYTHHVQQQEKISPPTTEEVVTKEVKYEIPCYFSGTGCTARLATNNSMLQHTASCPFNYQNNSKYFDVEEIISVYGKVERKLFLVK